MDSPPLPIQNIYIQIYRRPVDAQRMFFCPICRTSLLKYIGSIVRIVPGDPDAEGDEITRFPLKVKCHGFSREYGKCPAIYIIEGFVE